MKVPAEKSDVKFGWILAAFVALGLAVSQCSKDDAGEPAKTVAENNSLATVAAVHEPDTLFPLDASAVQRGAAQFRLIAASEIQGGAKIFSENCFEAVQKKFNSHQLDRCGGFDMVVLRAIERDETTFTPQELEYYQPETMAGRYLGALISGGEASDRADMRFDDLEALAAKVPLPKVAATIPLEVSEDATGDASVIEGDTDVGTDGSNAAIEDELDV